MRFAYIWKVTKNKVEPDKIGLVNTNSTGLKGKAVTEASAKKFGLEFSKWRVMDGDDEEMARGVIMMGEDCDGFEPLDDYVEGAYGAAYIQYWERAVTMTLQGRDENGQANWKYEADPKPSWVTL